MQPRDHNLFLTMHAMDVFHGKCKTKQGVPNIGKHTLGVFDATSGAALLPKDQPTPTVDMSTCVEDTLGFCWAAPLRAPLVLAGGRSYVIASSEDGVDGYTEMTDPATGTQMGHRIVSLPSDHHSPKFCRSMFSHSQVCLSSLSQHSLCHLYCLLVLVLRFPTNATTACCSDRARHT
jgi:hypothetical protein